MAVDERERDLIVNDINSNYFVSAGAGSGKTTTLVERIVTMICQGRDVSSIAAITFTKKAANEFYERTVKLLRLLSKKADFSCKALANSHISKVQTKETMENCKKALANIDLCFFGTIDSFCNTIISSHPMEAGVPASLELVPEDEMEALYKEEYRRILAGLYGKDLQKEALEVKDYLYNLSSAFPSIISTVLYNRQMRLVYKEYNGKFEVAFKDEVEDFKNLVIELYNLAPEERKLSTAKSKTAWEKLDEIYESIENENLDFFNDDINLNDLSILNTEFQFDIESYNDFLVDDTKSSRGIKGFSNSPIMNAKNNYIYSKVFRFLDHAIPKVSNNLKKNGKLTFFDNLLYVSEMLERDIRDNNATLVKHIRGDYKYFLLDEFQDTDPLQAKIFFYLSTDEPDVDWRKCKPYPGSIFIVGDEKQSIYAFRGASIDSFLSIKDMFRGNERLELISNFRSEKNVLRYFNQVFSKEGFFGNTGIEYRMLPEDVKKENERSIVANYNSNDISKLILYLMKEDNSLKYEDFMVITRATTQHLEIIEQFEEAGIPYVVEGKIDLSLNNALKLIFSLVIEKVKPSQENVFSILNLLGYSNQELFKFHKLGYNFNLTPVEGMPNDLTNLLNNLREMKYKSFTELFDKVIKEFDIFGLTGVKNMEYTYFMLETIRSQISAGLITTEDELVRFLRKEIAASIDADAKSSVDRVSQLTNQKHSVSVANLHKVKGLEAKVVILYDDSMPSCRGSKIEDRDKNERYIFNLSQDGSFVPLCKTTEYNNLQEESILKEEEEVKRLLYVAATRAKEKLFICNDLSKKKGDAISYWAPLREYVDPKTNEIKYIDEYKIGDVSILAKEEGSPSSLDNINEDINKSSYKIILPSKEVGDSKSKSNFSVAEDDIIDHESNDKINELDMDSLGLTSTVKGTMVHKLLEDLALSRNAKSIDIDKVITNIVDEFSDGFNKKNYKDINKRYYDVLCNVYKTITKGGYMQDEAYAPKDIYSVIKNAKSIYTEVPFCYKVDNEIYNGVIDLLYLDNTGYHIVDYKTNKESKGLDSHYAPQLNNYIKALKETLGIDAVDAKIYHIAC